MDYIGKTIGRYLIVEELGRGGMAVVYKARDTVLERFVAIKIILPGQQQTERYLRRFNREARSLAQLSHPSIVKIWDYGNYEETPYLVMEYISGGALSKRLGKPISYLDALEIIIPIIQALAYAHQQKIIHRDIKPGNILINESGQPLLSDFGIVKLTETDESQSLTGEGAAVGTPEYMAPEQARGKNIDLRVDIYALGVVLFEMITGRKPYVAASPMEVILKHLNDPIPKVRQIIRDLPPEIDQIISKAMAKKPDERFATANDLLKAIEAFFIKKRINRKISATVTIEPNLPDDVASIGSVEELAHNKKFKSRRFLIISGIILLICGVASAYMIKSNQFGVAHALGLVENTPTITNSPTIKPSSTATNTMQPATETAIPKSTVTLTKTIIPSPSHVEMLPEVVEASPTNVTGLITVGNATTLLEINRMDKIATTRLEWVPDGSLLVNASTKGITFIDPETMQTTGRVIDINNQLPIDMVISHDSAKVYLLLANEIVVYAIDSREQIHQYDIEGGVNSIALTADDQILGLGMLNKVQMVNISDGSVIRTLKSYYGGWCVAFSPDQKYIAVGTTQGVLVWSTETGIWVPVTNEEDAMVKSIAFSHDGSLLAAGSDNNIYVWDIVSGTRVRNYSMNFGIVNSIQFSPDDSMLLSGSDDGFIYLWNLETSNLLNTLKEHTSAIFSVKFNPSGNRIVSGANEGIMRLWGVP